MIKDLHLNWIEKSREGRNGFCKGYFDFVVSGQSLMEYFGFKTGSSVTPFGYFPSSEESTRVLKEFRLQIKPQLPGNRIELYICECCGDIGCGSITTKITDIGDKITWTEFADQSDPDELGENISVEGIEFNRAQYFKALSILR